jgi:hypothetical protein
MIEFDGTASKAADLAFSDRGPRITAFSSTPQHPTRLADHGRHKRDHDALAPKNSC